MPAPGTYSERAQAVLIVTDRCRQWFCKHPQATQAQFEDWLLSVDWGRWNDSLDEILPYVAERDVSDFWHEFKAIEDGEAPN